MTVRLGGDYAFSRPSVATLKSFGITFVSRYLSDFPSKNLTLAEAQRLSDGGIDIVSNWENSANDSTGGYSAGHRNALEAWRQHKACGGPDGRPIYFSIDADVTPSTTLAYFQGCRDALGADRVGVYGSEAVCSYLKSQGVVKWTWRTMSTGWRGGAGSPSEFNVEQTGAFNSDIDRDASITDDFGQWRVGQAPVPGGDDLPTPLDVWAYHGPNADPNNPGDTPDVHQSLLTTRDAALHTDNVLSDVVAALADLKAEVGAIKAKLGA